MNGLQNKFKFLKITLFLGDVFVIYIALFLTLLFRGRNLFSDFNNFFYNFLAVYVFWLLIIFVLNLYDIGFLKKPLDFFLSLIIFSFLALFFGMAYFYFRPNFGITPKTILVLNILTFDVLFIVWRWLFNSLLETKGIKERVVVIGLKPELNEILPQVNKDYQIEGLFCPPYLTDQKKCQIFSSKIKMISDIKDLKKIVQEQKVSSVLLALTNKDIIAQVFYSLPLRLNYIDFNDLYEMTTKKVSLKYLDEAWFLEKISRSEDKFEQVAKRLFDIFFSVMGMLVYIVFYPVVALLIKIDSKGPVLYCHQRVGRDGKNFTLCKFRNMTAAPDQYSKVWRERDKNNITRVGKIIRKLHLDELPQAWNILRGELSFVGPRPEWYELAKVFEKEIPFYKQRYLVKPGLFGWAQINFPASKSVNEAKEKFEYDLYYIKNHSLLLDLEIILKAIKLFFF